MKAKTKFTRLWSVLLVLVMVVGMIPIAALATGSVAATADFSADPTTALTLLNSAKTSGAADNVWDSTTNTLTLNGVNFETTAATAVKLPDGSTIVLNGVNTIKGVGSSSEDSYGIYADGALTIQGTGTLNVTGGDAGGTGSNDRSCGIYTENALTMSSGIVKAYAGTSAKASLGIYSKGNFTISGTADVTGKGGTAARDVSFGINAEKQVNISGGTVTAIGGSGLSSEGIYSGNGDIILSGGTVTAIGGAVSAWSVGIYANTSSANLQVSGTAEVTAIGGSAGDKSYGIYSSKKVTISGGTLTVATAKSTCINVSTSFSGFKTISFDGNGGSGEMIAYTSADSYTLPANGFTAPADKEFMGWSESSTGEVIEGTTINATDGKTLYAIWKNNAADFTVGNGKAALALLNEAKTGTADSEWNSSTKTLTLNGVNFETTAATAVKLPADATIVLNGENTIKGGNSNSDHCCGIDALGKLTIQGPGTLNVTGGATTGYYSSYGIYASRDLTIKSGTVIATGGTVSQDYNSHGIFVYSGYVTIESGTVIATGGRAGEDSCGINSDYVNIKGGKVEAAGGTAGRYSYGIYLYENITIEGGTVIAKAEDRALNMSPHTLPDTYQWRTSESAAYNKYPDSAYTFDSAHTYLEIKELEYTVTVNGGTASPSQAAAGTTVTLTANDAPPGEVFDKWVAESGNVTLADENSATTTFTMPAGNVSVKATYKAAPHTHSYGSEWKSNADKHWHECACGDNSAEAAHTAGDWITDTAATATTDGTKHTACTDCGYVMETGTIPATGYTVSFDANGGKGTMADVTGVLGDYTLPANGFTAPEGKQFKCWSVNGTEKAVGDKITVAADTTVKAAWENIPVTTYTVSFAANGGTGTMTDVTGVSGTYTLPENGFTAPEGKQFKAWSVNSTEKAVRDKIAVTADTTVKAVWENIPAAPTEYNILDGANSKWTQDSDGSLSIRGNGAFSEFVGVKVDGKSVDEKYYTVKEGSTIVTLKAGYLNTLTVGSHTLEIIWTDGSASTAFTVNAKAVVDNDTKSPQTGDNSMMALWIAVLFVSGIGVMGTTIYIRKKKYSVK